MYISNKYDFGLRYQFSKMLWHRKDKRGVISISKTDRKVTQTFLQYFKMTKLKETKVEDIILM